eukprot:UN0217
MEEEDNSQGTRVLTAYYQGTRVIEDKTAIFFHNLLLSFLNLIHVGSDLCLQANSAISHQESTVDKTRSITAVSVFILSITLLFLRIIIIDCCSGILFPWTFPSFIFFIIIPVLQEIEYIPRTRTYCLELKICETKTQFSIYTYSNLLSVCTYNLITGTYLSRNSATLGPINFHASYRWCWDLTHESSLFISVSISIIFHSIPVHNFASRDLQLIPVLQEIEYIPRTRMPSTGTQDTILELDHSLLHPKSRSQGKGMLEVP